MSVDAVSPIPEVVAALARDGRRVPADAVEALTRLTDILALGALADDCRRARHGARTTFVRLQQFDAADLASWTAVEAGAREVRLTGAPPTLDAAVAAVRKARALAGDRPVRGLTLDEACALGGAEAFAALAAAGLDDLLCATVTPTAAADVAAARAAGLGVRVVGTAAAPDDRAAWLLAVRDLVDAVGGIDAVAPLPRVQDTSAPTTGFDDVRAVALARIALDNVPSIQVDWQRHGPKLAQVALTVGADDLDGVPAGDDRSKGPRRAPLEEVRRNVTAAALVPVERDGRFRRLDA